MEVKKTATKIKAKEIVLSGLTITVDFFSVMVYCSSAKKEPGSIGVLIMV